MRPDIKNVFTGPSLGMGFAVKALERTLAPGERVLVVTFAKLDAGGGIAAVTDRRVLFASNVPGGAGSVLDIPLDRVASVNPRGGIMTGGITITTAERTVRATMRNKSAHAVAAKIREALSARPDVAGSGTSVAEQLATYANLLERGLLTREEFETKKAELL